MKKIYLITLLLLITVCSNLYAQYQQYQYNASGDYERELCQRKIQSYTKMKHWGLGLMIGGTASLIGGVILLSNGIQESNAAMATNNANNNYSYNYNNNNNTTTSTAGDGSIGFGAILIEAGIASGVGGVIFYAIGNKKMHYYKNKLSGLSLGLAPKGNGISITYRF